MKSKRNSNSLFFIKIDADEKGIYTTVATGTARI
jgi:hypothetical protein